MSKTLRVSFHSVMGWAGNDICSQTIQKEIRTCQHVPGHFWIRNYFFTDSASVHTYPRNPACESATFWIRYPERKFLNTYESGIVWTLNPYFFLSSDVTRFSPVLYREYWRRCRAQCYRFFTAWTLVSSFITCVQLNLATITVHLNYAKRRLDILKLLSMSDRRIGRRKQVKGATD